MKMFLKCFRFRFIDQLLEKVIANNAPLSQDKECLAISALNLLHLQVDFIR